VDDTKEQGEDYSELNKTDISTLNTVGPAVASNFKA